MPEIKPTDFIRDTNQWDPKWTNFPLTGRDKFACSCCGQMKIYRPLMDRIQGWRYLLGSPIGITSFYRCPKYNMQVSTTGATGPHTTGMAADLGISRQSARFLLAIIAQDLQITGLGVNQKGDGRFIHVDMLPATLGAKGEPIPGMEQAPPRPHLWSY